MHQFLISVISLQKKKNFKSEGCYYQYAMALLCTDYNEVSLRYFPSWFLFLHLKWKGIKCTFCSTNIFIRSTIDGWMSGCMGSSGHTQWCRYLVESHPSLLKAHLFSRRRLCGNWVWSVESKGTSCKIQFSDITMFFIFSHSPFCNGIWFNAATNSADVLSETAVVLGVLEQQPLAFVLIIWTTLKNQMASQEYTAVGCLQNST